MTTPDEADYTFILETPPPEPPPPPAQPRVLRVLSDLEHNLVRLTETPGQWARLGTYKNANTTRTVLHALKTRRTAPKRPDGVWEFRRSVTDDGKFGVWGRYFLTATDQAAASDLQPEGTN